MSPASYRAAPPRVGKTNPTRPRTYHQIGVALTGETAPIRQQTGTTQAGKLSYDGEDEGFGDGDPFAPD